jgi:prepilin-type N-terminal cleavage/methylation domain-containing protein
MRKLKAYTLLEMLVVMSIMLIILGIGFNAYASFTETVKFNQDVADLRSDILITQRAAMLLKKEPDENWVYGVGIDLQNISQGEYRFFKWCSEFTEFGAQKTKYIYPASDEETEGTIPLTYLPNTDQCPYGTEESQSIIEMSGYPRGSLNLKDSIEVQDDVRFILFESVSGRVFFYESLNGGRVPSNTDLEIQFSKNYGPCKSLLVKNLTGRIKVIDCTVDEE